MSKLIAYVPDDAFYYAVLGKNFNRLHRWTFDGTAPTTDFHLLWGYLNALLAAILPNFSFTATFTLLFWHSTLLCASALGLFSLTISKRFGTF